ncbi:MAG TPA: CheR family methyltransferase [Bryobacteraceae bacterium]|nr:CheR family methyltransferase [Bryobacteraceae bacterium]
MNLSQTLADSTYPALKQYVLQHTGLDYYAPRDEDFATRLGRRLAALHSRSCADYLHRLRDDSVELDALVGELTIGETYFFRQSEHFDLLRTVIIPDLLQTNRETRELRIWSAGCATGAEPYSIAIVLAQEFAGALEDWRVTILGTDINPGFLAQAREGRFSRWALRDVPESVLTSYFLRDGKHWILHPSIRDAVSFRYHNLTNDLSHPSPDALPFDLILCRNVMIYFSAERIRRLAERFHELLRPGGWLLPGHAEYGLDAFPQFTLVREAAATVYRRIPPPETPEVPQFEPAPLEIDLPPVPSVFSPPAATPHQGAGTRVLEDADDARTLADTGHWDDAAAICECILERDSLNPTAHFTLALVLAHRGLADEAVRQFRSAIYVDNDFALAWYHLGTMLQSAGDFPGARKAFLNVCELLNDLQPDAPVAHGDGIQVEELRELARMHHDIAREP